ncbi:MAG: type III-A CRISPR-associated protein Csm2 [candidate division KSB1 bacterium]|nr:type III-A CRISPR-associated protein Csm2 [candidate division KSB1 bacterium]MDZ7391321.1 type III-A CRISPR-associated protein Csm2 [candidate division KSB1 bacterium]
MNEKRWSQSERQKDWEQELQEKQVTADAVARAIGQGGKVLVELAQKVGSMVKKNGLTTSQIRNAYGLVKRMEIAGFVAHELALLKPKLAYAAARAAKGERGKADGAHQLAAVLSWGVDAVGEDAARFSRFVDLFEAILAYHLAEGGK